MEFFAAFERLGEKFHDGLLFITGGGADAGIGSMVQHRLRILSDASEVSLFLLLGLLLMYVKELLVAFAFLLAGRSHLVHFLKVCLEAQTFRVLK